MCPLDGAEAARKSAPRLDIASHKVGRWHEQAASEREATGGRRQEAEGRGQALGVQGPSESLTCVTMFPITPLDLRLPQSNVRFRG